MQFMMRINYLLCFLFFPVVTIYAQSEGLTSSPYSLYGLGVVNQTSIGATNGLGYTGIAMKSTEFINNLNPANFSQIPRNSFYYDIGVKSNYNTYQNTNNTEGKTRMNFSNIAFAFPLSKKLGVGITMIPYSDVGYSIIGIETNIEGATETFESNVSGVGGLSDLRINMGYEISPKVRVGANISFLFGNIQEEENFVLSNSYFSLDKSTSYSGARIGLGGQFDLTDSFTIGSTFLLPTVLNGRLKRSVSKILDGTEVSVEDEETANASDFKLPLELGTGISYSFLKGLSLNVDYKKIFWNDTNQKENIGEYKDQDLFGFGLEYVNDVKSYEYWRRIRMRSGYSYDNGYLAINDRKIEGQSFTFGIGLPISNRNRSMLNISYAYGSKGVLQNILIKENYHLVTVNLSLENKWFVKRKVN